MQAGCVSRPHRPWYMELARDFIQHENSPMDENGVPYYRNAMKRCGLSKNLDDVWRLDLLSTTWKDICRTHTENFRVIVLVNNQGIVLDGDLKKTEQRTKYFLYYVHCSTFIPFYEYEI